MAFLKTLGAIDFYTNSPNVGCGISSTSPLAGTGSLRVWKGTGGQYVVQALRNAAPYRFLAGYGYLRFQIRVSLPIVSGGRLGYYFLPTQTDLCAGTGRCYSAWLFLSSSAPTLTIQEYPNGLTNSGTTASGSLTLPPLALDTTYSLAVKWIVDIPRYGGLWVRAWFQAGALPDTTLTPQREYTFPLSVQPSTMGEGEWMRLQDTTTCEYLLDQVGRYALLVP